MTRAPHITIEKVPRPISNIMPKWKQTPMGSRTRLADLVASRPEKSANSVAIEPQVNADTIYELLSERTAMSLNGLATPNIGCVNQ